MESKGYTERESEGRWICQEDGKEERDGSSMEEVRGRRVRESLRR